MNSRDKGRIQGRFISQRNYVDRVDGYVYIFTEYGELLFFTEEIVFDQILQGYTFGKLADGYACAYRDGVQTYVHRLICNAQKGDIVDHINRNKKDNSISNLRKVNKSINAFNSK
jgi:hypothetical protein